jgi:pimeloyl-ACP methyl ester carboxylesterase
MSNPTIVLVHGAFADASGWSGVIRELLTDGYDVVAPPVPLRSLATDADTVAEVVRSIDGPVVLVGHSYGGAVITQASASLDNVTRLVYIAAFGLDVGDSVLTVTQPFPPTLLAKTGTPSSYDAIGVPGGPEFSIAKEGFRETFCQDSTADVASVLYATQRPLSGFAFGEELTAAGWKRIPSWFLIPTDDHAISPEAQQFMAERMGATSESIQGSHTVFIARPVAVADFIKRAAH